MVQGVDADTDVLGTFTGDVPRPGSPFETAVAKARIGMGLTGCSLGLASEGTMDSTRSCRCSSPTGSWSCSWTTWRCCCARPTCRGTASSYDPPPPR